LDKIVCAVIGDAADVDPFTNFRQRSAHLSIGTSNTGNGMAAGASVSAHDGRRARRLPLRYNTRNLIALMLRAPRIDAKPCDNGHKRNRQETSAAMTIITD
jgi:hypothetical protein